MLTTPRPHRKGFSIEALLTTIIRLTQTTLAPSFHMLLPLCMFFHYQSSLKIVRMPDFGAAVYVGGREGRSDTNDHAFSQGEKEDQDIAEGCRRLIKNTLIGWNYLYLTKELGKDNNEERKKELMEAIRNDSVMRWSHFNL